MLKAARNTIQSCKCFTYQNLWPQSAAPSELQPIRAISLILITNTDHSYILLAVCVKEQFRSVLPIHSSDGYKPEKVGLLWGQGSPQFKAQTNRPPMNLSSLTSLAPPFSQLWKGRRAPFHLSPSHGSLELEESKFGLSGKGLHLTLQSGEKKQRIKWLANQTS